eukprot:GHVN01081092.1.p1 GENE.GHVN01081092.1~~GHVN01081092.1.p1  ORF type:complete len:253 (+),score=47.88 GHVN01081092.1:339-1097(+)
MQENDSIASSSPPGPSPITGENQGSAVPQLSSSSLLPSSGLHLSTMQPSRVSITVERSVAGLHCNAVSCMLLDGVHQPNSIFTASRDGLIKKWSMKGDKPLQLYTLGEHLKWINHSVLIPDATRDIIVSCSDDKLIKVWSISRDSLTEQNDESPHCFTMFPSTATLQFHHDYVMCLAHNRGSVSGGGEASDLSGGGSFLLASGGLDGRITLFDLEAAVPSLKLSTGGGSRRHSGEGYSPRSIGVDKSVCSLW